MAHKIMRYFLKAIFQVECFPRFFAMLSVQNILKGRVDEHKEKG